jgi:uncharacterized protein
MAGKASNGAPDTSAVSARGTGEQAGVIEFLSKSEAYGDGAEPVVRIDTLISVVFLAGDRAYKLKRAIRLPYLDFSTIEDRRAACEEEIRVNRRTAPSLYLGVLPVVRMPDGSFSLGGGGEPVDWVVVMRRFDQSALLDKVVASRGLTGELPKKLADAVARFHVLSLPTPDFGGAGAMRALAEGNTRRLEATADGILDMAAIGRLDEATHRRLDAVAQEIEMRRRDGLVRHLHGDLHLRNVVLLDGEPVLFDGIEFSPGIACCDVLYDLAFLLMDLVHRRHDAAANAVTNRYLDVTGDSGFRLLPLFMSIRAAIRAHVTAGSIAVLRDADRPAAAADAVEYLALAARLLHPPEPFVLVIGGVSGTGKSSVAAGLAPLFRPAPGARHLRTDVIRKRMEGVSPEERLPERCYSQDRSARVYAELVGQAAGIAAAGCPVIADGVFGLPEEREAIESAAKAAGAPFLGLWLEGDPLVLKDRVARRSGDASDATPSVVERQLGTVSGPGGWVRIDATPALPEVVNRAAAVLGSVLPAEA